MDKDFKFGGSRIKRKAVALILLGAPGLVPLFFMSPAFFTMNEGTFATSVDDTLGTGAELCLFLCLLVTPLVLLTGQRWFVGLRRWYGIMMACCAIGDMLAAGLTDGFAGGFFGRVAGHVFELMGFFMVMLVLPLLATGTLEAAAADHLCHLGAAVLPPGPAGGSRVREGGQRLRRRR
jgi:DMSO/TMAO reductase YedYZ heme-binding membrane subunit